MIAMSVSMMLLLGVMGLAFDLGRIYIAKNEAQVFTDAAALTAALKIDGTAAGFAAARDAVQKLPMRWDLGTTEFKGVVVEFSKEGVKWDRDPKDASTAAYARVSAPENNVEITLLRAFGAAPYLTVPAHSVAGTNPVRLIE